jgi:hypothetical protein
MKSKLRIALAMLGLSLGVAANAFAQGIDVPLLPESLAPGDDSTSSPSDREMADESAMAMPASAADESYVDRLIWTLPGFWSDPEERSMALAPRYTDRQLTDFLIRVRKTNDLKKLGVSLDWRKHTFNQLERVERQLILRKMMKDEGVVLP